MKQFAIATTILALVACKSSKEVISATPTPSKKVEKNLLYTANDEEQWKLNYYDDQTATFIRFGDTLVNNEEMGENYNQDGMPASYFQRSDEANFYFELEDSRCMLNDLEFQKSITIFHRDESFQSCAKGMKNTTTYHDKWNLVNIPGMDNSRIYGMMDRPYLILNLEAGLLNGSTGCNVINGSIIHKAKKTDFGKLVMTKRGCNDMEIESTIVRGFEEANRLEIDDIKLYIYNGDDVLLEYRLAE